MLKGHTILCDSNISWYHNRYSKHHLMSRFARGNEVFFANPAVDIRYYLKGSQLKQLKLFKRKVWIADEHLTVYTPLSLPHKEKSDIAINLDPFYSTWQLKRLVRHVDRKRLVFFAGNPWDLPLLEEMKSSACTVYHCSDNFPALFSGDFAKQVVERERKVISLADVVITVSDSLYEKCLRLNSNTFLVRHGVDERFFYKGNAGIDCPADLSGVKGPRIGYIGSVDQLIDYPLLMKVIPALKDCSFVFIGTVDGMYKDKLNELLKNKNCFYLGEKNWQELPQYLFNFDVCIIPWVQNDFVCGCPLKQVEYLAAGKQTVVTKIFFDKSLAPGIMLSGDEDAFIGNIKRALANLPDAALSEKLSGLVTGWGWDAKTEEYSNIIEKTIELKQRMKSNRS